MATGSFPRAHGFSAGLACPAQPLGGPGRSVLHWAKLRDRISSPLLLSRLSRQPNHPREGPGRGLLGICPRLFPWFLWEEIQKKTESAPAEREGVGWEPALPSGEGPGALRRPEVSCCPQRARGSAGRALSLPEAVRTLGSSLHSRPASQMQFHGSLRSQILSKRLAWSPVSTESPLLFKCGRRGWSCAERTPHLLLLISPLPTKMCPPPAGMVGSPGCRGWTPLESFNSLPTPCMCFGNSSSRTETKVTGPGLAPPSFAALREGLL